MFLEAFGQPDGHFTEYYTNMIDCDAPVSCEICGSVNHLTKKCHEIKPCEFISQFARSASEGKCTFFLDIEEVDLQ
jgi:roadblock/LC7 domain-containing protein